MSTGPLVSAITIFLNAKRFLEEAIESVLAQTCDNWELLLVDDGSTDGSTAIARRRAERSAGRIRYLEHEGHRNRGMSASRNLGIRHARGEYLAFLDADDVWSPRKLERQVTNLRAQPAAGMDYGATQYWYSWTGNAEDSQRDFVPPTGLPADILVPPPTLLLRFLQEQTKPPATCSVLLRRAVVDEVGGFEETFRGMYEDQAFFAKVCLSVPVFMTSECAARYRQHADSCCARAKSAGQAKRAERIYLTWLARYVSRHPAPSGDGRRRLADLLWRYRHPLLHRFSARARGALTRARAGSPRRR
jgi:glycosyltransferase involved in cell wall biosynthesis